jgi:hypothetical protein
MDMNSLITIEGASAWWLIPLALANCLGGYFLFRILLIFNGGLMGVYLSAALVTWLRNAPTGPDYAIACLAGGIIFAMCSWYLYRLLFALFVAGAGGFWLAQTLASSATLTTAIVISILFALLLMALSFHFAKDWVIFATAITGAIGLVEIAGLDRWGLGASLAGVACLTIIGAFTQYSLAGKYRSRWSPNPRSGRNRTEVHPRFSQL